ncbi:hypothetical protein JG688_00005013 [Phytophthora aleatoria]|uniref:CMGC/CDK protein kinase n=1 Tax=Phytophthora aleatoria TaxID=2496075 RepID=A0A8J5MH28_9STRA|nr:hypothetical protein JG688_00005013 [Phytophthora aleatoria]
MIFSRRIRTICAAAALCSAVLFSSTDAWLPPIITKGNKFFDSVTGLEFRMKGMAYYPRPNSGEMAGVGNYDWAADEHEACTALQPVCKGSAANAYEHTEATTSVGDKRSPSNGSGASAQTSSRSGNTKSLASTTATVMASSSSPSSSSSPDAQPETTSFDQLQALRNVQLIERNEYPLKHLAQEKVRRRSRRDEDDEDDDEGALCFCTFPDAVEREKAQQKGEQVRRCDDVSCLNFATYVECSASCPAGQYCRNQRLQYPERYPLLEPFKTKHKGYGVRTRQHIPPLSIVGEDIEVGEELTFDYKWKALGSRQIKCFCGAPSCKGVIGTQNETLQNAEAQTGYFRDPEKQEIGNALVGRRVRVFLSPEDKTEYDVQLIKAYDEQQDRLESSFNTQKRNEHGELLDREGKVVSNRLLVKFLPKEYDERGWALVELESYELASSFRRTLDRRNLVDKMLRVYQAGTKELENFRHQKTKVQMMRQAGMTDRSNTSPSEEKENMQEKRNDPYCFGRKLNWLVTEDELKNLSVQQVLSASLEETLRVKYVKSIFHIAKGLRLDREDATSAIIALNRYFTFHTMPMEVDIYAATMLHLFLKAHARKVPWTAFVKEVYKAKHGSSAAERLTAASPELGVLKRHLVKAESELLEGLHYDVTGEDPYALLDLLTTRKSSKKLVASSQNGYGHQATPFLSSLPPPEVQKEAKHLVAEALPLPIWTHTPVECVMLSVVYLKDRWVRLERQSKSAQQKQPKDANSNEFDMTEFDVPKDKKDVDISERIARLLKQWINLPAPSSLPTIPSGFITFKAMGSSVPVPSSTSQSSDVDIITALSISPKKSAAGTNDTNVGDVRLHTNEIVKVESIRKRAFLGVISSEVGFDLAGKPVYLQSWPYLEQEMFFTEERGINEACLRELSAATTLSSLLPDRFMKLCGILFPADRKDRQASDSKGGADVDELDLLAATIDDDGNPLPEGIDRLAQQKHYLAFEQPLHMFSGIFEAHVSLPSELRKKAIFDMLQSLAAVHDQGYVHRFVAPSHLLVFKNGIKLGGFHAMRKIASIKPKDGEGSTIAGYEMSDSERKEHCYGAWLYVTAPEVLLGETKYTWRSDVWSAGCVVLAILLEKVPFLQGQDLKVQLDLIYRLCGTPSMSWEGAHKLPLYNAFRPKHEYKMRLRKTLLEQRSKFPDFPEDAVEVLEAMLQLDPARRSPVKRLLEMRYFDSIRSSEQTFDFSDLPSTFPVQKKKLVQHLLKSKAKKHRSAGSRSSTSARSSHHHTHSSEHHRHKRSASSTLDGSVDKPSHQDRHKSRSDKRKSRSLSTSRRDVKHAETEDVEMQDASEYVPLPESFTASAGSSPSRSTDDSLPPREKRAKLGWGMGLNSVS